MIVFRLDIDLQFYFPDTLCTNNDSFVLPLEDITLLIFLIVNSLFFFFFSSSNLDRSYSYMYLFVQIYIFNSLYSLRAASACPCIIEIWKEVEGRTKVIIIFCLIVDWQLTVYH